MQRAPNPQLLGQVPVKIWHDLQLPEAPAVPFSAQQEEWYMLNPHKIETAIRKLAAY